MGTILDGSELFFFDSVNSNMTEAAGIEVNYYSMNKQGSVIDPLYGEYAQREVDGPWRLSAKAEWPQRSPISGEAGYTVEFDGKCTISRVHFEEKHAPYPIEGDVLEMWRTPYHDINSLGGLFFDILKVLNDGHLNDSPTFTQFVMTLKRRPQFAPERRLAETEEIKEI